jgi:hypothetical protein
MSRPLRPLRFYELWLLRFLARSPRIDRILVEQRAGRLRNLETFEELIALSVSSPASGRRAQPLRGRAR